MNMNIFSVVKRLLFSAVPKKREKEMYDLVSQWAIATKKTGSAHRRSRRNKIIGLRKHGLDSDYAEKMREEIRRNKKGN